MCFFEKVESPGIKVRNIGRVKLSQAHAYKYSYFDLSSQQFQTIRRRKRIPGRGLPILNLGAVSVVEQF